MNYEFFIELVKSSGILAGIISVYFVIKEIRKIIEIKKTNGVYDKVTKLESLVNNEYAHEFISIKEEIRELRNKIGEIENRLTAVETQLKFIKRR